MVDTSSSSSSEDDAPARRSNRLSADRGVIKREAWAATSESESDSSDESATEDEAARDDDSDDMPLAQREEADVSESSDETEDEEAVVKQEPLVEDTAAPIKAEESRDGESENSSEESEKEESDGEEADEISVKSEQDNETESEVDGSAEDSDRTGLDAEELKSEEEDASTTVAKNARKSPRATLAGPDETEDEHAVEHTTETREHDAADDPDTHAQQSEAKEKESNEGTDERHEPEEEADEGEPFTRGDFEAARQIMDRFSQTHLSFTEQVELHKGKKITGPPIDRAISQRDQWKRKYRWPVALRNVRRRRFIADATELAFDHDVRLVERPAVTTTVSDTARKAFASALAPTARPLMAAAITTFKEQIEQRDRDIRFVERLEETKESDHDAVDATRLRALARLGGHFTDQLLDSILVKNVLALQGLDASYAQQCWDPLPTSKRPVANWRFVLEHFCRTSTHGVDAMAISSVPPLRKDTLMRIRDRLKALYGVSWRPEDDAFFNLVDQQAIDPPDPSEVVFRL